MKMTVRLPWLNKIRARLKEKSWNSDVYEFIEPIMEYGESEEKRITEEFAKDREEDT